MDLMLLPFAATCQCLHLQPCTFQYFALRRACSSFMAVDYVARAREYGRLSNLHDLYGIERIINDDAVIYGNEGRVAIIEGMRAFRRRYKDVFWVFHSFELVGPRQVEFAFDRYWRADSGDGAAVMVCSAAEVITFTEDGLMQRIDYSRRPTDPQLSAGYPEGAQVTPTD